MVKKNKFTVGVIGATGQGDYGHNIDTAFYNLENAEIIAVADNDTIGLKKAGKRLGVNSLYLSYELMLKETKPDIAVVCPSWVSERVSMVEAASKNGCHIFCEKPFAGSIKEADKIYNCCKIYNINMAIAHQWRAMPPIQRTIDSVKSGKFGKLLRMWARPKDDNRGGGEELLLHGSHLFDLMIAFAGIPIWVSGFVSNKDRQATLNDVKEGNQPVGPIMGDSISAIFCFNNAIRGFFESTADLSGPKNPKIDKLGLYGLTLECEKALLVLREPGDVYIYPAPKVLPDYKNFKWKKLYIKEWHNEPNNKYSNLTKNNNWIKIGNKILAADFINSLYFNHKSFSNISTARYINEMVQGVYLSHLSLGKRKEIPLLNRNHPLLG